MQHSFQEIALKEIEKTSILLKNKGFSVSTPDKKLYNFEIIVNSENEKVKLLIFFGKKGVKKVLQGFEQGKLYKELKEILLGGDLFEEEANKEIQFDDYIGTDESGKGDYFGPLVVSAVYLNEKTKNQLKNIGVKDSKLLSDFAVKDLERKIKKVVSRNYDTVIINPAKYNQLYESFANLNKLLGWAHAKAIENLILKINCKNIISDKFGDEQIIKNELIKKKIELNLVQTPKAERYIGVAAASILARAKVIAWFELKSKELKVSVPKGAGESVTNVASKISSQIGKENLKKMIKFHFKISKNIF
jgi:ribonuclease HIII